MALVNQGGALRVVGGALGTGQACCCGGGGGGGGGACCLPGKCVLTGRVTYNPGNDGEVFDIPGYAITSSGIENGALTTWYEKILPPGSPICTEYDPEWDGETPNAYWDEHFAFRAAYVAQADNPDVPGETFNTPSSGLLPPVITPASCVANLSEADCQEQGGTYHPGKTCAEEPCLTCFERALLGDEAYVDGWCANAASSVGFAGSPCEFTTATCGTRTLVNDYGGFGDWIVTVCCDNPLP